MTLERGACLFPVKRNGGIKPCGEPCTVLDANGNTRSLCGEHVKEIGKWYKKMKKAQGTRAGKKRSVKLKLKDVSNA